MIVEEIGHTKCVWFGLMENPASVDLSLMLPAYLNMCDDW
jgi:hypothetical protein